MDGTLVPTRDHTIAERSKNYRYSTNHQVVVVGQPLPGRLCRRRHVRVQLITAIAGAVRRHQ